MAIDIDTVLRVFPAVLLVTVATVYAAKQMALAHRDGVVPVHRGAAGGPQRVGRRLFEVFRVLIIAGLIVRVVAPEVDALLAPLVPPPPVWPAMGVLGAVVMLFGVWLLFYSHAYMGVLWRSGVPSDAELERGPDALLQRGPFARTRNPIFVAILVTHLGLALVAPSILMTMSLAVCALTLRRQVSVEEANLRRRFGPSYDAYCARTPRWLVPRMPSEGVA